MLHRLFAPVIDAVLPQDCFLCGLPAFGAGLCAACRDDLPRPRGGRCPVCALPAVDGQRCGACLRKPPAFDATRAVFEYGFPVDVLVQALKYRHRLAAARILGSALAGVAVEGRRGLEADCVVPLPLHRRRLAERGFNQAVEIARPLARALQLPLLLDGVARVRDTAAQESLDRAARRRNLRRAFACTAPVEGLSLIVVDDVMTTGASLDEFARCLKAAGARRVENWVIARTPAPG